MKSIIYVNTPLTPEEHRALATLARAEGRSKGQQLRALARQILLTAPPLPPQGTTDSEPPQPETPSLTPHRIHAPQGQPGGFGQL